MITDDEIIEEFAAANPASVWSDTTRSAPLDLNAIRERNVPVVELGERAKPAGRRSGRGWVDIGVAATIVAIVVAGVVMMRRDDSGTVADRSPATSSADDATGRSLPAPELSVGDRLVAAFSDQDVSAIRELLAYDATVEMMDAGDRVALSELIAWFEATRWRFEPVAPCVRAGSTHVRCDVVQHNAWSDARTTDGASGEFLLEIDDGSVSSLVYDESYVEWENIAIRPFREFVWMTHADDLEDMWLGGRPYSPQLTDESIDLFERYTAEYVAAMQARQSSAISPG